MLLPSHSVLSTGMIGITTVPSPNLFFNQCRLRTQSVRYCAEPTSAMCESDPSAMMVPVPNLCCPIASASAWRISCNVPSSTRTILRHSPVLVDGTHAGKDWSAATMATGCPSLPASAPCTPDTHVLQTNLLVSKDVEVVILLLMLCTILHLRTLSSPPLVKLGLTAPCSTVVGDGFKCRRLDAAFLAAMTVA